MSFLFRPLWLRVPDAVYFALLFGGTVALTVSIGVVIHGIARKKDPVNFSGWSIAILISLILVGLTATGKIAPNCSFGG